MLIGNKHECFSLVNLPSIMRTSLMNLAVFLLKVVLNPVNDIIFNVLIIVTQLQEAGRQMEWHLLGLLMRCTHPTLIFLSLVIRQSPQHHGERGEAKHRKKSI